MQHLINAMLAYSYQLLLDTREFPKEYAKHHNGKLEYHQNLINVAQANIKAANAELAQLKDASPTREQFYELTRSYLKPSTKHEIYLN